MWTLAAVGALADVSTEGDLIYRSANVAAAVFPACLEPELQAFGRAATSQRPTSERSAQLRLSTDRQRAARP